MQPIFVGGFLRSGTTLVQSLLCSGKSVGPMIGECVYLRGVVETYLRSLSLFEEHTKDYFDTPEDLRRFCAGQAGQFLEHTWRRLGEPEFLVLKHPQLTRYFPPLHALLPKARLVVCIRDPRDNVASAVAAQRRGAREFGTRSPAQIAASLLETYLPCFASLQRSCHEQTAYLKYEALVQDPAAVIPRLARFTGVDLSGFDPAADRPFARWQLDASKTKGRPFHSDLFCEPIKDSHVGRYRDILSDAEVAQVEQQCAPLLALLARAPSVFRLVPGGEDVTPGTLARVPLREVDQ